MRILLTGANGYIGKRLLPNLVQEGHTVICCVRDKNRFNPPESLIQNIEITEIDFLDKNSITKIPQNIDGAYYLMHSMTSSSAYEKKELICASNFKEAVNKTKIRHVVYLSGIINETSLSRHLLSRKAVEDELAKGNYNFTTLRAGIIIGSGSASFEIIRDLTEKIPLLLTPIWVRTKCQPIGVRDVKNILTKTMFNVETYNKNFDIGGPDILTYKEMLLGYAKVRGLKRKLLIFPLITPKISSYWLYFLTSTSYKLATALVQSMNVEVVCRNCDINKILDITPIGYEQALKRTLLRIEEHQIVSSWKDSLVSGRIKVDLSEFMKVPTFGCNIYHLERKAINRERSIDKIWSIGGNTGWYRADWLWGIRGFLDKVFGGVGLRRGRTDDFEIHTGDAVDFWRVLYANKEEGRLLLYAEMRLPGEAWLEFRFTKNNILHQTATYRPKGLLGRLYWISVYPFHGYIFKGMINKITE